MEKRSQTTRFLIYIAALLPLMLLRDITPANELKYLSIADESLRDGHFWTMFNQGVAYADKPPLYIWIIMGLKLIFGRHIPFLISLFSLVPALVTLSVFNRWCRAELKQKYGLAAELALLTTGFFLGGAIVLRMDMLMTMFITLAMWTFYRQFNGDNSLKLKIAFPVYVFLAIFSKGPVGFFIPLVGVPVWLAVCRKLRDYFHYWGWMTWLILALLCGIWFTCVYFEGGKEYIENLLVHQTVGRTVNSFHHKAPIFYYLYTYWYAAAPWSVLVGGTMIYALVKKIRLTKLTRFMMVISLTTLVMMSIVSSKLAIYILPAFGFMNCCAFLILQEIPGFGEKAAKVVRYGAAVLLALIFIGGCFIGKFNHRLGYREVCTEASAIAKEKGITQFYCYKLKGGTSMDTYLGAPVKEITEDQMNNPQDLIGQDMAGVIIFAPDSNKVASYKLFLKEKSK